MLLIIGIGIVSIVSIICITIGVSWKKIKPKKTVKEEWAEWTFIDCPVR